MRSTITHRAGPYRVTSWGNGMAYELAHIEAKRSVLFQTDYDVRDFEAHLDAADANEPYAVTLARMWEIYSDASDEGFYGMEGGAP